jgi:superoxide dismutase
MYLEAFFSNIDWQAVERRLEQAKHDQVSAAGR